MVSPRRAGESSDLRTDESPLTYIAPSPNLVLTGTWEKGQLTATSIRPCDRGFYCDNDPALIAFAKAYAQKTHLSTPLPLQSLPPFTQRVLEELQKIPYNQTLTYSQLAARLGSPKAARAVGSACGRNPFLLLIPCHRIVASQGLGGFAAGLDLKKFLLDHESK